MTLPSPFSALAISLQQACARDLPPYPTLRRHELAARAARDACLPGEPSSIGLVGSERAVPDQCDIVMFPQVWSSGALGYETFTTSAPAVAYTVLVRWHRSGVRAVYFGDSGRLAYLIPAGSHVGLLRSYVADQRMPDVGSAAALGWKSSLYA